MTLREKFVDEFGENNALVMEQAANDHKNGVHDNPGSDTFRWAICICIGHECFTRFADYHGFDLDAKKLKQWIKDTAHLEEHDGDVDYLAVFSGAYDEFMPIKEMKE